MDSWLIGSAADCDIVVSQQAVSGRHCRLRKEPGGFYLEDLGSRNGTFVGGKRIASPRRVTKADSITLGTQIALPWPGEASEDAPAAAPDPTRGTITEWPTTKIFLSYRRGDSADVTGRIDDRLVDAFGRDNVFKDVDSIPLGVDFRVHLSEAVGDCHVVLVVMGERWVGAEDESGNRRLEDDADFVRIEVESALQRNIPVVPVLLGNAQMPKPDDVPSSMREICFRNATKVRPDPDFGPDMTRIIQGIKKANPMTLAAAGKQTAAPSKQTAAPSKQSAAPAKQSPDARSRKASAISVRCHCGKTLRAPEKLAGTSAKCPACGSLVRIPAAAQPAPTAAAPSPAATVAAPSSANPFAASAVARQVTPRKKSLATPLMIGCGSVAGAGILFLALIIAVVVFNDYGVAPEEYGYDVVPDEYGYEEAMEPEPADDLFGEPESADDLFADPEPLDDLFGDSASEDDLFGEPASEDDPFGDAESADDLFGEPEPADDLFGDAPAPPEP